MKPETLEALLLDRSLGELEPETSELLDAYLAQNPDASARSASLQETARVARAVLGARTASPTPARVLPAIPPWRRESSPFVRIASSQPLKLAACVAIGVAAGWLGRPMRSVPAGIAALPAAAAIVQSPEEASAVAQPPSLPWSARMLARAEASAATSGDRSPARFRLRWESPARKPILEEIQ